MGQALGPGLGHVLYVVNEGRRVIHRVVVNGSALEARGRCQLERVKHRSQATSGVTVAHLLATYRECHWCRGNGALS